MPKTITFITGTRADYGKLKPLMQAVHQDPEFNLEVFVTGMHLSTEHGSTYHAVLADAWPNIHVDYASATNDRGMSQSLGTIIQNLSNYLRIRQPDLVVVHGDRIEALAGACASAISNIRLAHIEGGEISGTIDESLRHAITKLAHEHFVCTEEARTRIGKLGERLDRIYTIGSPDIDLMLSDALPSLESVCAHYDIHFKDFAIALYHPVTTQLQDIQHNSHVFVQSLLKSQENYIVIYPNNDIGYETILASYEPLRHHARFRLFPSVRFEAFLCLLKHAQFMIGNSSAGVREAGIYGVPALDIGDRQAGRYQLQALPHLYHSAHDEQAILKAIEQMKSHPRQSHHYWGDGQSAQKFHQILKREDFWLSTLQKRITY